MTSNSTDIPARRHPALMRLSGIAVSVAVAIVCAYAEGFGWGAARGMWIGLNLLPVHYPAPRWNVLFSICAAVVVVIAVGMLFRSATRMARGAVMGGVLLFLTALSAHAEPRPRQPEFLRFRPPVCALSHAVG